MTAGARPVSRRPASSRAARPSSARGLALRALMAVEGGARANEIVPKLLGASGLAERDRAFVTELVYGTVRMRRACDWLVDHHVHRKLDARVRGALRLGAYQLAFLGTPPHAAVSATVAEVEGPGRGLVNAVLRRVADDVARGALRWPDAATELSYPDWIVARLTDDVGAGPARAALEQMNRPAAATQRADGYFQDEASQQVAAYVAPEDGDRVLDLCAAPGGKATALAQAPGRPSVVVAADISDTRCRVIAENVSKLGLDDVPVVAADGTASPFPLAVFDRVLVDAPCSGLGVLRRRPDARWRIQPDAIDHLVELQRGLVDEAVALLRPGGLLVYSVCTLTEAETLGMDRWLAHRHRHLRTVSPPGPPWEACGRGGRLFPQVAGTDGMFVLALRAPVD
jgi:16S rRNA (cytosine967-C5)-methyltransferase